MSNDWNPDFTIYDSPKGWTGADRPEAPPPPRGWEAMIEKIVSAMDDTLAVGLLSAILNGASVDSTSAKATLLAEIFGRSEDLTSVAAKIDAFLYGQSSDQTLGASQIGLAGGVYDATEMKGALALSLMGASSTTASVSGALSASLAGNTSEENRAFALWVFAPMAPVTTIVSTVGVTNISIPGWATIIDIISLGGGSSGQTGSGAINSAGKGGLSGEWNHNTIERGSGWMTWGVSSMKVEVGAGGPRPPSSDNAGPNKGGDTAVSWNYEEGVLGGFAVHAPGGSGKNSGQNGGNAGSYTVTGINYQGGSGGTGNAGTGGTPGGGGAGGNGGIFGNRTQGGAGGPGRAWVRFYQ